MTARRTIIASDSVTQMGDKKASLVMWEGVSGEDRDRVWQGPCDLGTERRGASPEAPRGGGDPGAGSLCCRVHKPKCWGLLLPLCLGSPPSCPRRPPPQALMGVRKQDTGFTWTALSHWRAASVSTFPPADRSQVSPPGWLPSLGSEPGTDPTPRADERDRRGRGSGGWPRQVHEASTEEPAMFSQDRRQPEGRGRRPSGLGPHKGCHVGRARPRCHERNTFQQAESCTSSRGVFVMRNCVTFLCSGTFCGSPSPARESSASHSAFKAPVISLRAPL